MTTRTWNIIRSKNFRLYRIARAMHVLPRMRAAPLFLTFALYALCPRFDSFDSFAMERENAAPGGEEGRGKRGGGGGGGFRLQTTLKFDRWWRRRTRRIWGHRNFSLSPAHGRPANLALRCMYTSKSYTRASCAYRAAVRGGSIPRGLPVKRCNQL